LPKTQNRFPFTRELYIAEKGAHLAKLCACRSKYHSLIMTCPYFQGKLPRRRTVVYPPRIQMASI
jgi:hypothetical protein